MPIMIFILCWIIFLIPSLKKVIVRERGVKIRINTVVYNVLFFLSSIFLALNTYNADYIVYERIYETYGETLKFGNNFIFGLICKIFYRLNFDYLSFRCLVILFSMFCVYRFIEKYSKRPVFIFILYLVTSYVMDGIQFRQFMAMAVFLTVLPALISDNKNGKWVYILGIAIASGIHISFIFFYCLLLIKVERKKRIKIAVSILVIFLVSFWILQKLNVLITVLNYFIPENKIALYITGEMYHNEKLMVLLFIVVQPLLLLGLLFLFKKVKAYNVNDLSYIYTIIGINLLVLCLLPMYFYSLQFRRILRIIFIPSYIAMEKMLPKRLNITKIILVSFMYGFSFISWYWNISNNVNLLTNMFQNNYLY